MSAEPKSASVQNSTTGGVRLINWNATDEKLELFSEGLEVLEQLADEPLCVLAITGRNKTGKTFLGERLFLEHKPLGVVGSSILSTIQKGTQGMTIYSSSDFKTTDSGVRIVLVDTEGLGATHCSAQGQTRMFAVALLISSCLIYNSFGAIDEGALEGIEFVAQLAQELKSESGYSGVMPDFHWLLRDFSLKLEELGGKKMTPEEYLESCLELSKGTSDTIEKRNKTRRVIKHLFPSRDCSTMIRPTLTEFEMQRLFSLKNSDLRAEFAEQARKLRTRVVRKIQPKRIGGKECTGRILRVFLQTAVEALNSRHAIHLPSLHQRALEAVKTPTVRVVPESAASELAAVIQTLQGRVETLQNELAFWQSRGRPTLEVAVFVGPHVSKSKLVADMQSESWGSDRQLQLLPLQRPKIELEILPALELHPTEMVQNKKAKDGDALIRVDLESRLGKLQSELAELQRIRQQEASKLREVNTAHSQAVELLAAAQIKLKEFDAVLTHAREEKQKALAESQRLAGLLDSERMKLAETTSKLAITASPTNLRTSSDWKNMLEEKAAAFICLDCTASIPAHEFLEHNCNSIAPKPEGAIVTAGVNNLSRAGLNTSGLATTGMGYHTNLNTSSCLDSSVLTIRRTPNQVARRITGLPDGAGAILTQNYAISAGDDSATPRRLSNKHPLQAEIVEVNVKESAHNKKLYAEYRIKATRGKKTWESHKKYREFCEFASGISAWVDVTLIASMPESVQSIFKMANQRSQIGTSTIADRQTQLQDLLNWVCQDPKMSESSQLKDFLQEPESTADEFVTENLLPEDILSEGTKLLDMKKADSQTKETSKTQSALLQVLSRKQNFGSVVSNPNSKPKNLTESPNQPNSVAKKESYHSGGLSQLRASASSYLTNMQQSTGTAARSKKAALHTQSTDRHDETLQSVSKRTADEFKRGALFPDDGVQRNAGASVAGGKTAGGSRASSQQKPKQTGSVWGGRLLQNKHVPAPTEPASPGRPGLGSRKKSTPQLGGRMTLKPNETTPGTPAFRGTEGPAGETNSEAAAKGGRAQGTGAGVSAGLFSSPQIGSAVRGLVGPGLAKQLHLTSGTQPRPLAFTSGESGAGRRVGVLKHLK